jgi:hypothetical protein
VLPGAYAWLVNVNSEGRSKRLCLRRFINRVRNMKIELNWYWGLIGLLGFLGVLLDQPLFFIFFVFFLFFIVPRKPTLTET